MAKAGTIVVERDGGITTVTLNRPDAMNSISMDMHYELQDAFDAFAEDSRQRVCIVTAAGERAFCTGCDLKVGGGAFAEKRSPAWQGR